MKIKRLLFPALVLFTISCKKTSQSSTLPQDNYLTTTAGSTWNYHQVDSSGTSPANSDYTLTSSSKDTLVNGRSYHVFNTSTGSNQYLTISGSNYYQFDSLPATLGIAVFERLYLKDNVSAGNIWTQNLTITVPGIPFPVPVTLSYQISEKGISRTVNAITYNDVIHVSTLISSSLIPSSSLTSSINSYYAKKYGLIENSTVIKLNFSGIVENINIETKIVSATLL